MIDRSHAPVIHPFEDVVLPGIRFFVNNNGVNVYFHPTPHTGTFKLELYCKNSQLNTANSAECQLSLKLLKEGTTKRPSKVLAEYIDSLGSFLEITPGFDNSSITIYGLSRYFKQNVQLLRELVEQPAFKESSLKKLKLKEVDRLKQNKEKSSYISSTNLRNALFGTTHPYGHILKEKDIQNLTIQRIYNIHQSYSQSFDIYLSGDISDENLKHLNEFHSEHTENKDFDNTLPGKTKHSIVRSEKFVQSSIKIGKRLFTRSNKDYIPFMVTNEILGGYFGSRLMKNIREEKGLTYGIYSHLYALGREGYFFISSDVKAENEDQVISEIHSEISSLQNKLVKEEELNMVKNYMIGTFMNSLSNPFGIIEKYKILISQKLNADFYDHYVENIKAVSSQEVKEISNLYLQIDSFTQSLVGTSIA